MHPANLLCMLNATFYVNQGNFVKDGSLGRIQYVRYNLVLRLYTENRDVCPSRYNHWEYKDLGKKVWFSLMICYFILHLIGGFNSFHRW